MEIFELGESSAQTVLIQPVDEHDLDAIESEFEQIRRSTGKDLLLRAYKVKDWNKDLSPWKAPAVFGKEDFGDGAPDTLSEILKSCEDRTKTYYIGGYSLAGLFSLWAVYQTDLFKGVAAASPSMWFPGFDKYMKDGGLRCGGVYLSLGDKEEKARNSVMATVVDKIRAAHAMLLEQSVNCVLEWNQGNHFKEPDVRTAKGFAWLLNQSL